MKVPSSGSIYHLPPAGPLVEVSWDGDGPPVLSVEGVPVSPGPDGFAVWHRGYLDEVADEAGMRARIVESWRRRGPDGWGSLRGAFAFVLVDTDSGRLAAARDPLGLEPLFHGSKGRRVWFSQDLNRLVGPGGPAGLDRGLDRVVLAEMLLDVVSEVEETVYAGIRRLPGGWARVWRSAGVGEPTRIWDPLPVNDPIDWHRGSPADLRDELKDRLERVASRHLARCGAARTGIFLSSGIDSVTLAALAARKATRTGDGLPLALSLRFQHPSVDESSEQRHVAAVLGLEQVFAAVPEPKAGSPGAGPLSAATALGRTWPQPLLNLWLPYYGSLAQQGRERGIGAVWTGTGGDEWLSVTPLWAAELWRKGRVNEVLRLFGAYARSQRLPLARLAANLGWRFGLRPVLAAPARRWLARWAPDRLRRRGHRRFGALAPPWLIPEPSVRAAVRERISAVPSGRSAGEYLTEMRRGLHHPIPAMEMEETWEAGRRIGVSWVHPFLDADLVTWLARLHPRDLLTGGWSKGLARNLLANSFPELGVDRLSKPHVTELFRERVCSEGPSCLRAVGSFPALTRLGLLDGGAALDPLRKDLVSGSSVKPLKIQRLWQLIHQEAWLHGRLD